MFLFLFTFGQWVSIQMFQVCFLRWLKQIPSSIQFELIHRKWNNLEHCLGSYFPYIMCCVCHPSPAIVEFSAMRLSGNRARMEYLLALELETILNDDSSRSCWGPVNYGHSLPIWLLHLSTILGYISGILYIVLLHTLVNALQWQRKCIELEREQLNWLQNVKQREWSERRRTKVGDNILDLHNFNFNWD